MDDPDRNGYRRDMALAATTMIDGKETLIAVARYVLEPAGKDCEFAIVVADAWQGRGIGRRMMEKLIKTARGSGIENMYGDILSVNVPMLALLRRLGYSLGRNPDDATVTRATLRL